MADIDEKIADFHVRLGKLELAVRGEQVPQQDSLLKDLVELGAALIALFCCYQGLGFPNHYYQYLFAAITMLCLYHRGTLPYPNKVQDWALLFINIFLTAILYKLIIGGGEPRPLAWLSYPTIEGGMTSFKISWAAAPGAGWVLPLTSIQSFFLVISIFALMIDLSLLAGLTTFILTLLAIPTLFSFNWDWALPGIVVGLFSLYLQTGSYSQRVKSNS